MAGYAIGHLRDVEMGEEVVEYLKRIDGTLAPFQGKFRIHGGRVEQMEGKFRGNLIVIEFPDIEAARNWYHSDAYQQILPFRTRNSTGEIFLTDGVDDDHKATDILQS